MDLGEILDATRQIYVSRLTERIADCQPCFSEAALCTEDGVPGAEGLLELPRRVDIVRKDDGEFVSVDSPSQLKFSPIAFDWDHGLRVDLQSILWDACDIQINAQALVDWEPLRKWFLAWFDLEEQNELDDMGLIGTVHYLSDPELVGENNFRLQVDLGSAPVEAFEELLDAVAATGAKSIGIG